MLNAYGNTYADVSDKGEEMMFFSPTETVWSGKRIRNRKSLKNLHKTKIVKETGI